MTYHHIKELNPRYPKPGQPRVLNESIYCQFCWDREFEKFFEQLPLPKSHLTYDGDEHERCDSCRPLNI